MICLNPQWGWDTTKYEEAIDRRLSHEIMWEVYAASYDRILSELPFYQEVVERHCDAMSGSEIHSILDIGAGTGIATLRLIGLGKRVTAVDVNGAMLRRLFAKLGAGNSPLLSIVQDTAERMPQLGDGTFDGVSVLLAFFDMDDPWSALREAIRVLKPGGKLIITDPRSCFDVKELMSAAEQSLRSRNLLSVLGDDWHRIQTVAPLIRDTIDTIQSPAAKKQSESRWNAEEILQMLRTAGFRELKFLESHVGNCATISGRKPDVS